MDLSIVLHSGIATGTVLLFATIGELLCERSGVLNLGVEGMMLMGAMSGFSVAVSTGNPWLALFVAMLAAGEKQADPIAFSDLAQVMADASICGLGHAAANPLRCALRYFPEAMA